MHSQLRNLGLDRAVVSSFAVLQTEIDPEHLYKFFSLFGESSTKGFAPMKKLLQKSLTSWGG